MDSPPCHRYGRPLNHCAQELVEWRIYGSGDLWAAWAGWRIVGSTLISPERDRIDVRVLQHLLATHGQKRLRGSKAANLDPIPRIHEK